MACVYFHLLFVHAVFLSAILLVDAQDEILANPGFEEPLGSDDWFCNGPCTLTRDGSDAHTGQYSGLVTNRYDNLLSVLTWRYD